MIRLVMFLSSFVLLSNDHPILGFILLISAFLADFKEVER